MPPPVIRVPKYIGRNTFLDVPAYTGNASKALVVNGSGDGFQYVAVALATHAHAGEDITSGTVADARIASTITRDNEVMTIVLAGDGSGSGLDADLLRGVTPSAYILTLADDADAATARATLGLGALATAGVPGSTTQVIYNSAGALTGDAGMTYDAANDALTVAGRVVTPVIRPPSDSVTAGQWQTAAGTAVLTINTKDSKVGTAGNFGVGTTTPSPNSFWGSGRCIHVLDQSSNLPNLRFQSTGVDFTFACDGSNAYFYVASNSGMRFYTNGAERMKMLNDGRLSKGSHTPTAALDIEASTTSWASLRFRSGVDPTSPNDGDIWYNSRLKFRRSATTEIFATGVQAAGGVATAGATYGATEQTMLQAVYNVARTFGLLS